MQNRTYYNENLILAAKKLISTYPQLYIDLVEKPALNDFAEIPNVISFIEREKDLDPEYWGPWYIQLQGKEKSDFVYTLLGVIVLLYDPEFTKFKKQLRHKLRSELSKHLLMKGNIISDRLQVMKNLLETYPFFTKEVHNLANEYKSTYLQET